MELGGKPLENAPGLGCWGKALGLEAMRWLQFGHPPPEECLGPPWRLALTEGILFMPEGSAGRLGGRE